MLLWNHRVLNYQVTFYWRKIYCVIYAVWILTFLTNRRIINNNYYFLTATLYNCSYQNYSNVMSQISHYTFMVLFLHIRSKWFKKSVDGILQIRIRFVMPTHYTNHRLNSTLRRHISFYIHLCFKACYGEVWLGVSSLYEYAIMYGYSRKKKKITQYHRFTIRFTFSVTVRF